MPLTDLEIALANMRPQRDTKAAKQEVLCACTDSCAKDAEIAALRLIERDVNDQRAVANLVADGHKPFKPQQIQTFQQLTALNPGWRNCRRAPVESQTVVAS